ncbi:MAG: TAXI family TRAP transporter solute-binding subunit [Rhodobacteraceae bacterium]|nr:TAXI family TRAP transporter solute-binding subunit [Paracoccaceae bacterium]
MPSQISRRAVLALGFVFGFGTPGSAQEESGPYILATAEEGGTYYPVGVALAVLTQIRLQGSLGISMEAVTSGGSLENIRMMRDDEAQFGILQVLAGQWARDADGPLSEEGPQENLRAITMLWPDLAHFLIRSDLVDTGTIDDLANLAGLGFSMGPLGSGTEYSNAEMFRNYGFDYESWQPVFQSFDVSAQALLDGSIAGVNIGSGIGVASVTHILTQMGDGMTLLSVTDDQAAQLDGGQGFVGTTIIPPGTYPGVDAPLQTVTMPNFLAVNADVPEEEVYQITRTMFENLAYLCDVHQAACALSLDSAVTGLPVPLHPGAERYFREAGIALPVTEVANQ